MSRRAKLFVSLAVVFGALGYLVSQSIGQQMVYAKYPDELLAERDAWIGRPVRVEGIVDTIEHPDGTLRYRFIVSRGRTTLPVRYEGIVPDTFREGAGVTVRGRLEQSGTFHAEEVIAKCPSKYEMQARQAAGQAAPHALPPADPNRN
jgi:cytochrome c-type biogenesis protein CcmE